MSTVVENKFADVCRQAASSSGRGRVRSASVPPLHKVKELPRIFHADVQRIREQYQHLYDLPVIEFPDGSRSFQDGLLFRCHGVNLLFLKGDFVEMAFQHGRLLEDQIPEGAPPQSAKMVACAIANAMGVNGRIPQAVAEGVHRLVTDTMLAYAVKASQSVLGGHDALDEAIALADTTGIPVSTLVRALFNPETLLMLARVSSGAHRQRARILEEVVAPAACCSAFAAWGTHSTAGRMLIGRNMDYPLNGFYDRFPTVIYFEPTGGYLKYMTFASAGIHNGGLTAFNEAGLFLCSHTVPTYEMSAKGIPVFATACQVIRRATTFEAAIEIFRALRPPTGWAYTLVSTREGRVGTVELSNRQLAVRMANGGFHVQTNHFLAPEMVQRHLFLNTSVTEDSEGRFERIRQRIEAARGQFDVEDAISVLADQVDPLLDQVRGLGNTVGVHTNMTSIVLDPERGRFYFAVGPAPAAHTEFIELPLIGSFDRTDEPQGPVRVLDNRHFEREHPEKWQALQLFIQAKCAYEQRNEVEKAYELLQQVVESDPSNPAYFFQLGIFALKNRRFDEAIQAFNQVLDAQHVTSQLKRLASYYRGRTHAHQARTADAIRDLMAVVEDADTDEKLRTSANRVLWRLRTWGRCRIKRRNLTIMMQQSDMVRY